MAPRPAPAAAVLLLLLAGCSGAPGPTGDASLPDADGDGVPDVATGPFNYTTGHPGGEPFTLDLEGSITPEEFAQGDSVPTGPGPSCCSFDWVDASDLLAVPGQLLAVRVTVNWTNTPDNHAGLDAASCVPWWCAHFEPDAPNEAQQFAAHSSTITINTAAVEDFFGFDGTGVPFLGVRYADAAVATELAYTIHVEAFPVGDGLGIADPYLFAIPENGTLTAELVGPFTGELEVGLMFFGADDRPAHWHAMSGPHLSRHAIPVGAGEWVVFPFEQSGGFARLSVDAAPADPDGLEARRLEETFAQVEVATVADAQDQSGTYSYEAPPGSLDTFPWFVYDDKPAAQDTFGLPNGGAVGGAEVTLASSSGDIAVVDIRQVSIAIPGQGGRACLQCNGGGAWSPENYVDDDGTYDVTWRSRGGSGTFVLFTAQYTR